jgi:glycosyltransferase involved in cell wall biosynthesis
VTAVPIEPVRRRIRVMFLIPALDIGGAERVVARTAARLDPARFDTVVAAFIPGTDRLRPELRGVETVLVGRARGPALGWQLLRTLRRLRPDVLLTFMFHANVAGRLAGRLARVPVIVSSERVVGWEPKWRIVVNRLTVGLATAMTTNSIAGRDFWADRLRQPADKVHVIYNGIDLEQFPLRVITSEVPRCFGVLARLHRANGHRWLLDALHRLQSLAPEPWTCRFAGDGPERSALEVDVNRMGLSGRVIFDGFCTDASSFLRSIDAYIHPALVAGMPNAVLEAMATGLPVIATGVGGTAEAVQPGLTGYLINPGDVDDFARHALNILRRPGHAAQLGAEGRRRVEEMFSLDAMVKCVEQLLNGLVTSEGTNGQR